MSINNPRLHPLQAPPSDSEAATWFDEELRASSFDWLSNEADNHEYFADRAHRKARKPPRRQSVKKLLESGQEQGRAFGDPGLQELYEKEYFSELLWQLRSGKEATLYVVRASAKTAPLVRPRPSNYCHLPPGEGRAAESLPLPPGPLPQKGEGVVEGFPLLAAKLYVDSRVRSFKNDALYRQGRYISDKRVEKAIDQRSQFGVSAQNILWVEEEYRQLHALHQAGMAVPRPIAHAGNVILMEFIGDDEGPAPRLSEAGLNKEEAQDALEQAIHNLGLMLAHGKVHGDYSTFNLLWWEGKAVVIDFPQVVEWDKNPRAKEILERDVNGLCRTFGHLGLHPKGSEVLRRVWQTARENATPFTPMGELL
ncbi:RIO1 family regulatory kinase/ATPase [uncultured Meiothermus sp.]|jgi:RIO kinase 1|uniref:RIO1 family regulatory kinase/ATPase domain-containing protein n=1 Tax=uncultured Meiothermus sp. TaxID=157471 RepID=UPI00262A1D85|nr:RIO1 family regulatory kinase/ATPase [uncultured Meiothermus sp.]